MEDLMNELSDDEIEDGICPQLGESTIVITVHEASHTSGKWQDHKSPMSWCFTENGKTYHLKIYYDNMCIHTTRCSQ